MSKFLILILLALGAQAAVTDFAVMGTTPTQMVISYVAPDSNACTLEASKSSSYSPSVEDVDNTLYPSSHFDSRAGNIASGRYRVFVLGKQGQAAMATAADGYRRSRALQADTLYHLRISCGVDVATTTGRTANIGMGDTRGESLAISQSDLYQYDGLTANTAVYPDFADPWTGALVKRPTAQQVFAFGGSSSTWADGSPHGDCNRTLTSPTVNGSCLFTDAAGTNWTATTGTLTDAVRGNDSNYAEYSGTGQDILFIRLGTGKYPSSGSPTLFGGALAWQNIVLRALTTDATGDGGQMELCVTFDAANCYSPWLRHSLTTSEATIRFCKDVPCSASEASGDVMVDRWPADTLPVQGVKVYNVGGDLATLRFVGSNATAYCNALYVGEDVVAADSSLTVRSMAVSSKSCGSSPPQVTIGFGFDLTVNGTAGVTLYKYTHMAVNPRYGVLVRKVSTTSGSTIKIGYALWRMAVNTPFAFALGSGGFGKRCQNVLTAQGEYLCQFNTSIVGIKYAADGSMLMNNYGFLLVNGTYLSGSLIDSATYGCMGNFSNNDTSWSDTEPGVFYCLLQSNYNNPATSTVDNRYVLVKITIDTTSPVANGDPDASGIPGLSNKAQRIPIAAASILTPCLAPCTSVSDDYTPYGQMKRYDASWNTAFGSYAIEAVQGNTVIIANRAGNQDTYAWVFVYDLGNGLPVGSGYVGNYGNTQHIFGGFRMPSNQACRWCGLHTWQPPLQIGGANYTVAESTDKCSLSVTSTNSLAACSVSGTGTCSACPGITMNGFDYTGKSWCSNLQVTSSWNGAWGTDPGLVPGDPVLLSAPCNGNNTRWWGQQLQVGDFLIDPSTYEIVRIIQRNSNTNYDVVRGWGYYTDPGGPYAPKAHSSSVTWNARCGLVGLDPTTSRPELTESVAWWYKLDPAGTNAAHTYRNPYQNHAFHAENFAIKPEYLWAGFDNTNPATLANTTAYTLQTPWNFAGKPDSYDGTSTFDGRVYSSCSGNGCEKHPTYAQILGNDNARSWFVDVHPRLGHGGVGTSAAPLVSGKTYIREWQGTKQIHPKFFDLEVYTGFFPFRKADAITDSAADSGKFCYAVITNDCFSGSTAGKVYIVFEDFDTRFQGGSQFTCREAEFAGLQGDLCVGNSSGIGAVTAQWKLPMEGRYWHNGTAFRTVSKYARIYRDSGTENVKVDPEGKFLLARGSYYVMPPRFPKHIGSRNGSSFAMIPVQSSGGPAGTSTAVIEFGYDTNLFCSKNRDGVCIAESASFNGTTPYLFASETITGAPCASGCTVSIPAIHNRVVYYRWKYRDSGGSTIFTGPIQVTSVQ